MFGLGAESMAAGWPHFVAAPTPSASISLHMTTESVPPHNLADCVDFLGFELIDSSITSEKLHQRSYIKEATSKKLHLD